MVVVVGGRDGGGWAAFLALATKVKTTHRGLVTVETRGPGRRERGAPVACRDRGWLESTPAARGRPPTVDGRVQSCFK